MKINEGKTKAMIFSTTKVGDPEFMVGGKKIDLVNQYPFLGVSIDYGLRFSSYNSGVVKTSKKRVNVIKCLANRDWGNSMESQRTQASNSLILDLKTTTSRWTDMLDFRKATNCTKA